MRTFICSFLCLCLGIVSASAESTRFGEGLFRYAEWGHSLYADEHPNFVRMDIPYTSNRPIYDYGASGEAYRWQTMGIFGMQLPSGTGRWATARWISAW